MDQVQNMELSKDQIIQELIALLNQNQQKEAANDVLFGKLSAPTFFTLNAPVFQMVWINIQNFCICLRSLFKVSIV